MIAYHVGSASTGSRSKSTSCWRANLHDHLGRGDSAEKSESLEVLHYGKFFGPKVREIFKRK